MPRTIIDVRVPERTASEVWPTVMAWLSANGFQILIARSDGQARMLPRWDGDMLLRPRLDCTVALRQLPAGPAIVLEISVADDSYGAIYHVEGYVTGRGWGWKGKEFDFIPQTLAVAGIPRSRGLLLLANLKQCISTAPPRVLATGPTAAPAPPSPSGPARRPSSGKVQDLLPGEVVVRRFDSSSDALSRVVASPYYSAFAILMAVIVPLVVYLLSTIRFSPSLVLYIGLIASPALMTGGLGVYCRSSIRSDRPTTVMLTNQRIVVDRPAGDTKPAAMSLEDVATVELDRRGRAARRAGVAWVCVLPKSASMTHGRTGRVWNEPRAIIIPAMRLNEALELRSRLHASGSGLLGG